MISYHVDLSLTRPNDNMLLFSQKFDKSRPNYPTDVRDKLCFQNIEFSGREVRLQIGADGYEKVEKC